MNCPLIYILVESGGSMKLFDNR